MTLRLLILSSLISNSLFSKGQDLVIANTRMNILYIGIHNPIQFASKSIPVNKIVLTAQRGETISNNGQFFYQNCRNEGGELIIYAKNKQTNKVIDSAIFRLKYLPEPIVRIAAPVMFDGVYVGKDIVNDFYGVYARISDDYEFPVNIVSFKITVSNSAGLKKILLNEGHRITPEVKNEISKIEKEDTVVIHDVKVRMGCVVEPRLLRQEIKLR